MISPFPLHNLIFFPNKLDSKELYTPLFCRDVYEYIPEDIDDLERQIAKIKQALYSNSALMQREVDNKYKYWL